MSGEGSSSGVEEAVTENGAELPSGSSGIPVKKAKVVLQRIDALGVSPASLGITLIGSGPRPSPPPSRQELPPQTLERVNATPPPVVTSPSHDESSTSASSQNGAPVLTTTKTLPRSFGGRVKQHKLLKAALGNVSGQALPGALFLWGPPSAGKSHTLEGVLEGTGIHQIKVHSAEILCGRRAFYETLVKQLVSSRGRPLTSSFKCDSLHSLFSNFTLFFEDEENKAVRVAIIIEGAESLRGENEDLLQFLISLQNITQGPVCVIFISTLPPGMFMPNILDHTIIPIHFPQYSMEEITQILCDQKVSQSRTSRSAGCYDFYVKMIVSMFYYVCRDLRKLMRLSSSHWETFRQMVEDSVDVNLTRLWKKLEPQLKSQFFEMNSTITTSVGSNNQENPGKTLDMPANSKYLLIASYLATHNPASSDKRFFVKSRVGRMKKSRAALKTDINNSFARSFELNRLNAIFGSVQEYCDDKAVNKNRNISFMTLLTTLCQNKMIQHLGEDVAGNQKYKCLLDYDTVLKISRSVDFELNNYLYRLL